jgi:peptidoglycan/xylan/chitin deacetylase (PgdA/CDA1 family)
MRSISKSNAFKTGGGALVLALAAAMVHPSLALVPLTLFVLLCLLAPFVHRLSFYLPVISRGNTALKAVALTFDDGPDPMTTHRLLKMLKAHQVKATFFVTGQKALAHPELIRAILRDGHTVGNHSFSHNAFSVFKGPRVLYREIARTQKVLARLGVAPLVYRPPVGITYPMLGRVLSRLDLLAVNFSCCARDWGNRRVQGMSGRILKRVRAGDIVMLHDLRPAKKTCAADWLVEVDRILRGLKAKGLIVRPLEQLIGHRIDRRSIPNGRAQTGGLSESPSGSHCASKAGRMPGNRP